MKAFSKLFQKHNPDQEHIDAFHAKYAELHELGKHLHDKGYHIHIEYPDKKEFRMIHADKGGKGATSYFNADVHASKKVTISKSALRHED